MHISDEMLSTLFCKEIQAFLREKIIQMNLQSALLTRVSPFVNF